MATRPKCWKTKHLVNRSVFLKMCGSCSLKSPSGDSNSDVIRFLETFLENHPPAKNGKWTIHKTAIFAKTFGQGNSKQVKTSIPTQKLTFHEVSRLVGRVGLSSTLLFCIRVESVDHQHLESFRSWEQRNSRAGCWRFTMCGVSFLMILMMFASRISWTIQCQAIKLWRVKKYDFFLWASWTPHDNLRSCRKTDPTNCHSFRCLNSFSATIDLRDLLHNEKAWKQCSGTCPALPSYPCVDAIGQSQPSWLPFSPTRLPFSRFVEYTIASDCLGMLPVILLFFIPTCNLMLLAPLCHKKENIEYDRINHCTACLILFHYRSMA